MKKVTKRVTKRTPKIAFGNKYIIINLVITKYKFYYYYIRMTLKDFFNNIDKNILLLYISISILTLYIFTNIIQINIGHLLALIVTIIIIIYFTDTQNTNINDFNIDMEYKLKSILNNEPPPDHFHLDVDLINLFYDIKNDFGNSNYVSYRDAVISTNNILQIRNDLELKICKTPKSTISLDNFNKQQIIEDNTCNSTIENSYQNYQIASQQLTKTMNHLHSLKYNSSSDIVMTSKFHNLLKRGHLLLKRNLDIIKDIHNDSIKNKITSDTKFITDYDLPKSYTNTKNNENLFYNT